MCGKVNLSDFADIAQVIIAIVNIALAVYIFIYQRDYNNRVDVRTSEQNLKNTKLQWFKELIIQPRISKLWDFYKNLESLSEKIKSDNLSDDEIIALNRFINDEAKAFRVNFYDVVLRVDNALYQNIKIDIESLVTQLTTAISDEEHKLTNIRTFEREILDPIKYSQHNILNLLVNYAG